MILISGDLNVQYYHFVSASVFAALAGHCCSSVLVKKPGKFEKYGVDFERDFEIRRIKC
jgi:hypothetical protein